MTDIGLTLVYYNNFSITLRVVVVGIAISCFRLSLDCGQRLSASGRGLPSTGLMSWVALCYLLSLICKPHAMW